MPIPRRPSSGILGLALAGILAASCAGAVLQMDCRLEQGEYLTEAAIPLRLFLTARETATPVPILVHADYPRLGPRSCFQARCWGPDGRELPPALAAMPDWMERIVVPQQVPPGGPPWSVRIDLGVWFRPPPGGPYRVEVSYVWRARARGKEAHWVGATNAATAQFRVRELNYGPLSARERAQLDDLLEFLKLPQARPVARDEAAALGPRALTALHDALLMGHLPRRAAIIDALAILGDERSLIPIIAVNSGPTEFVPRAKERALRAYGERAIPAVVEGLSRGLPDALPLAIRLGPAAVEPLVELVRRGGEGAGAAMACLALGQIGDARALPALREVEATRPALRHTARVAIRDITARRAPLGR